MMVVMRMLEAFELEIEGSCTQDVMDALDVRCEGG